MTQGVSALTYNLQCTECPKMFIASRKSALTCSDVCERTRQSRLQKERRNTSRDGLYVTNEKGEEGNWKVCALPSCGKTLWLPRGIHARKTCFPPAPCQREYRLYVARNCHKGLCVVGKRGRQVTNPLNHKTPKSVRPTWKSTTVDSTPMWKMYCQQAFLRERPQYLRVGRHDKIQNNGLS